jgi:hypothetical protein
MVVDDAIFLQALHCTGHRVVFHSQAVTHALSARQNTEFFVFHSALLCHPLDPACF